jgi:hypothetical protein
MIQNNNKKSIMCIFKVWPTFGEGYWSILKLTFSLLGTFATNMWDVPQIVSSQFFLCMLSSDQET